MTAVEGDFRADAAAKSETPRRVEQAVATVIAERQGQRRDQEAVRILDVRAAEHAALDRSKPLAAVGPRPLFLPDEITLTLQTGGKIDRLRRVSGKLLV